MAALDKEAKSLIWSSIFIALGTVAIILMFVLPVSRARAPSWLLTLHCSVAKVTM